MEPEDKNGWFSFIEQLKNLAIRDFNSEGEFNITDLSKYKYSMQGQAAIKEGLFENWAGTKTRSWNGMETEARLMIKHKRVIGENDARYRYVESLFVETAEGERYKLPFIKLTAGRAMLEHVRQGGKPYDIRGNHISQIVEEMKVLSRFKRANHGKIFEGVTAQLVESAGIYHEKLQHNLKSLSTKSGYAKYFEAWDPAAITEEDVIIEDLRHMFVEQNIDSRVEQALPLLAKLQREQAMQEANIFESWANLILEGIWALPDTKEKQAKLVELLGQELAVGPDAINAIEQLNDLFGDDELFDKLVKLSNENADADARDIVLSRLEDLKDHPVIAQVIGKLVNQSEEEPPAETPPAEAPPAEEPPPEQNMTENESKQILTRPGNRKLASRQDIITRLKNHKPKSLWQKIIDELKSSSDKNPWHSLEAMMEHLFISENEIEQEIKKNGYDDIYALNSAIKNGEITEDPLDQLRRGAGIHDESREDDFAKARQAKRDQAEDEWAASKSGPAQAANLAARNRQIKRDQADDEWAASKGRRDESQEMPSALEGQYGHSGKMKPVTGGDADTIERLRFLSGITK